MMSSTLGAPLGGTMRGGHQVFDPSRVSLITPPNCGSGAGIRFPLIVVVALGSPSTPVICCACTALAVINQAPIRTAPSDTLSRVLRLVLIFPHVLSPLVD